MNRWEAFQFVCASLRASLAARPLDIAPGIDWPMVITQASQHRVTPMMALSLAGRPEVPADVRDYFAAVQTLAAERAAALRDATAEMVEALSAIGAEPVLLKGAAALAQDLYPAQGVRVMADIDVLVAGAKMRESSEVLLQRGFRRTKNGRRTLLQKIAQRRNPRPAPAEEPHHDAPFFHPRTGIHVELHRALAVAAFTALLPAQDALRRAISVSTGAMTFSVLAPTDRIVHHIVHAQLHHEGARHAIVDLRQLADLAVLVDRLGGEIDWNNVEDRFAAHGHAGILADYLGFLAALLDRPVAARVSDLEPLMARLRAGVEVAGLPTTLGAIAADYWQRLRRRPALVVNALDPRFWPDRLADWYTRLRFGRL